jgi:4,5-DOPA dioxygenase extradiol
MNAWPTLFVSHGAPNFATEPGLAGAQLHAMGQRLGKPRAAVVISPHWMTPEATITAAEQPQTLHDFGGFPRALYSLRYPSPGSPALAARIHQLLSTHDIAAHLDDRRGLDHGAWVPLLHLYPDADVPVLQVSLPLAADEAAACRLGRALAALSREGVLVIGSGSLTHNLRDLRMDEATAAPYVQAFSAWVRQAVVAGDLGRLAQTLSLAPHAARAHPSTEHFLPLLVAAAASHSLARSAVLEGDIRHGALSMESYLFG